MYGYNKQNSRVWHKNQRCSGTYFPASLEMSSKVAENRGLNPCSICCDSEWPHNREQEDNE